MILETENKAMMLACACEKFGHEGVNVQPASRTYKTGSYLFRENDLSKDMYLIRSGKVRVTRRDGPKEVEICTLGPGSVLGEMALIDGRPRSASVQAVEETQASLITPEDFSKKTQGIPSWFLSIIRIVIQRLRESNKRLHSTVNQNLAGNVATLLKIVFDRYAEEIDDKRLLDLKLAKKEIINILGLSLEDLNKTLQELTQSNMVTIEKNRVEISDPGKFARYGRYLRIRSVNAEDQKGSLSAGARKCLLFLYENRDKHGKRTDKGMVYQTDSFAQDLADMLGESGKTILEEVEERGFLTIVPDPEAKNKEDGGSCCKGKLLTASLERLEELAVVEEFEGTPPGLSLDMEGLGELEGSAENSSVPQ